MLEYKFLPSPQASIKALEDREFEGYGATYGDVDQGGDVIAPGAFSGSLGKRKIKMLRDHDPAKVLGAWTSISEDERGLRVKGLFAKESALAKETYELIGMGALDGLSIGYRTKVAERGENGTRVLKEIELWEVSVVTFPMNEMAQIDAVKSAIDGNFAPLKRVFEDRLRDAGLGSRKSRAAEISRLFTQLSPERDAGELQALADHMRKAMPNAA